MRLHHQTSDPIFIKLTPDINNECIKIKPQTKNNTNLIQSLSFFKK